MRVHLRCLLAALALGSSTGCVLLGVGAAGGGVGGGVASAKASNQEQHSAATYTETVVANVVYFPAKALFAGAGAITSGVTYLATGGSHEPAGAVWRSAVDGDYILTPDMIEGSEPIHFVGEEQAPASGARS